MDELAAFPHGRQGVGVVLLLGWAIGIHRLLPMDIRPSGFQISQQHLLVLKPRSEEQLIEAGHIRALLSEELLGSQLLPPGPDHRAAAEQGQLGGCYQAIGGAGAHDVRRILVR